MRDWLTYFLLESPLALGILLALVNFTLLVSWRRSGRARPLLIGLAVAGVLLLIQASITTQREHAWRLLTMIERDVRAGEIDGLRSCLSERFTAGGHDREEFVELVAGRYDVVQPVRVQRTALQIGASTAESFQAEAAYLSEVRLRDFTTIVKSRWRINFVHDPEGWKIISVTPLEPFSSWSEVAGFR